MEISRALQRGNRHVGPIVPLATPPPLAIGVPNKTTLAHRAHVQALRASGKDPITFFSDLLKNEQAPLDLRFQAAKELAPYMHPKLSSIEARTGGKTHEQRLEELRRMKASQDRVDE